MANIKSAKKRILVNETKAARNKAIIKGNRTQQKYCVRFLFNFYLAAVRLFYIPYNKMRTLLDEVVESGQLARVGAAVA